MFNRTGGLLLTITLLLFSNGCFALSDDQSDAKLKATYFFNTLKFAVWPDAQPINVMLIGDDSVTSILEDILANYQIQQHQITVGKITPASLTTLNEGEVVADIDAIYVSEQLTRSSLTRLLRILKRHKILTISTYPGFAELGGMIEISHDFSSQRFVFIVNIEALKQQGLKLQSQFLRIAKPVEDH